MSINLNELNTADIIENCNDCIVLLKENSLVYANKATLNLFQCDLDYIIDKNPWEISPKYQPDGELSETKAKRLIAESVLSGNSFIWYHLRPNKTLVPVEINITAYHRNGITYCKLRDMSEQFEKEQILLKQQNILEATLNGMAVPAFMVDTQGKILYWNTACEILTGLRSIDMIGTDRQWEPFYNYKRPVLADLIAQQHTEQVTRFYIGKHKRSTMIKGAIEAEDYFVKLNNTHLFFTASPIFNDRGILIGAIETFQDVSEAKETINSLSNAVYIDELTTLYNKFKYAETISNICESRINENREIYLAIIDIDNFKQINDKYGHFNGDIALKELGNIIKTSIRETDLLFRFGGEEFLIILEKSKSDTKLILERLRKIIEDNILYLEEGNIKFSISTGVTELELNDTPDTVFKKADSALYLAKNTGKNRIVFY